MGGSSQRAVGSIRKALWMTLFITVGLWGCSTFLIYGQTRRPDSKDYLQREIEPKLQSILPPSWSLKRARNTFELTRTEKLWVYNRMQRPIGEKLEDTARHAGREMTFTITLRFEPLLPNDEYQRLKRKRAPFERVVNKGAPTIDAWSRGVEEFHKLKLPVYYTDRYSVYADKPDGFPLRVYPESAARECNQLIDKLDRIFQRYEPPSGKNSDFQVRF